MAIYGFSFIFFCNIFFLVGNFFVTIPHLNRRIQKLSPVLKPMLPLNLLIQEPMASKLIFTVLVWFYLCFWLGKGLLTGMYSLFSVLTLPYQSCSMDSKGYLTLQLKEAKWAVSSRLGSSSSRWPWFFGKNNWSKNKRLYAT